MKSKAALVLLALVHLTCHQVLLTAPPDTTILMQANPIFISLNGDSSVITVVLTERTGTPVADGTVVQFFTTLGHVDEQAKTNDGVAHARFVSDSRAGTARITAISGIGGTIPTPQPSASATPTPAPSSTPTPTPSATPTPGPTPIPLGQVSASDVRTPGAVAAESFVDVTVGTARGLRVSITADPTRLVNGRATTISAIVFDDSGNFVANAPVLFRVVVDPATEVMDSQGRLVYTDNNGRATDVMRTRRPSGAVGTARVEAFVPSSSEPSATVDVFIQVP